jgi:hypothetical protein
MPTEAEFLVLADRFDRLAQDASVLLDRVQQYDGPEVITGGVLRTALDKVVYSGVFDASRSASEAVSLAQECRARAQVCAQYTAAMSGWRSQMSDYYSASTAHRDAAARYQRDPDTAPPPGSPPTAPREPHRPYSWVSEGTSR